MWINCSGSRKQESVLVQFKLPLTAAQSGLICAVTPEQLLIFAVF